MKFSIALFAAAVAFTGAVSAAPLEARGPAPGTYANCNSNPALKSLSLASGYAVITGWDNNAANVPGIQQGADIGECLRQCASTAGCTNTVHSTPPGSPFGYCYPKNDLWDAININANGASIIAIKSSCKALINGSKVPLAANTCCDS